MNIYETYGLKWVKVNEEVFKYLEEIMWNCEEKDFVQLETLAELLTIRIRAILMPNEQTNKQQFKRADMRRRKEWRR